MPALLKLKQYLGKYLFNSKETDPRTAYDIWAASYDNQPDNLMLALDEEVFCSLLNRLTLKNKIIADVGCGTGRHWKKLFDNEPKKLIGFDVSGRMLKILKEKFPLAEVSMLINNRLKLQNESCDCIISTLTIAHIRNAAEAIAEWTRVLKPGGHIIITDYHPVALAKGGKRTFKHNYKTIAVKNYLHPIKNLEKIATQLDLHVSRLIEKSVDEHAKPYYEKQKALQVYELWKGVPIIYGLLLTKKDAAS